MGCANSLSSETGESPNNAEIQFPTKTCDYQIIQNPQPSFSIFTQQPDHCYGNHRACSYIKRLLSGLEYYSMLDVVHNNRHKEQFINFIHNKYQQLLDDYIHFIRRHQGQIEYIHKDFTTIKQTTKCSIETCSYAARHHLLHHS